MKINQDGLNLIKQFEGCRLQPYLCSAGVPTIGYGSTFYEDGTKVTLKDPQITQARAETLLANTLAKFESGVSELVKVPITPNVFSALVSFAFNVGLGNLKASTLLKKINNLDMAGAALEFQRWNKAGGKEVTGLTRRREAERALFVKVS